MAEYSENCEHRENDEISDCSEKWKDYFLKEAMKGDHKVFSKIQCEEIIRDLQTAKATSSTKTNQQIRRMKRFDILEIDGVNRLIAKGKSDGAIKYYAPIEEMYDIIHQAHIA
ncbi:hypothetical protein TKK_0015256, partial [Trichogramma kaykai]